MAFPTLENIKAALKKYPVWFALDIFLILAILAVLSTTLTISVLLIPVITSALTFSLLPTFMMGLIPLLPLIVSVALLFWFLYDSWVMIPNRVKMRVLEKEWFFTALVFLYSRLLMSFHFFSNMSFFLFLANQCFSLSEAANKNLFNLLRAYSVLSALTAVGLGIYLSVAILPSLILGVAAATGLPYAAVALFGALAAVVLIMMTYELLMAPLQLTNQFLLFLFWQKKRCPDLLTKVFGYLIMLTGIAVAAYASYIIFPMTVNILLPLLPQATAAFTALTICASLVILTMVTVPIVIHFLENCVRKLADKFENKPSELTLRFKEWEVNVREQLFGKKAKINLDEELAYAYSDIVKVSHGWIEYEHPMTSVGKYYNIPEDRWQEECPEPLTDTSRRM